MPVCKNCKDKFVAKWFNQKMCMAKDECIKAFSNWVSEQNKKKIDKAMKKEKQAEDEKWKGVKVVVYEKENKEVLQNEINKLSKLIDARYWLTECIDCGGYLDKEKNQIDACHLISRKKNGTLRYNLHNLHSGHNYCNVYNESHESNYKKGLIKRYGKGYLKMVELLPIKYKEIHLSSAELVEKIKLVRKVIRTFPTYQLTDSMSARTLFNNLIGIYN